VRVLALDVGSSSVKAAVLAGDRFLAGPVRVGYPTSFVGVRAEIDPGALLDAVASAVGALGAALVRGIDVVAPGVLSPSWVAMDPDGAALTPIVTHADRRSVAQARELERRTGRARHLALAGNRPVPGGIASTTWAWYVQTAPELMARAALVGQLGTYLLRQFTGARVIDPSNASFLGVYATTTLAGWCPELLDAVGGRPDQLPRVLPAAAVAGTVTPDAAGRYGLPAGAPVLTGCVDGSAALLAAGARAGGLRAGQLVDAVGSTDVLAMCAAAPAPGEGVLTRALGVDGAWVSVATLAAAGSALDWAHRVLFAELPVEAFRQLVARVAAEPDSGGVRCRPTLAGERTGMTPLRGAFDGVTLATTREHLLSALVEGLAAASAARVPRLARAGDPQRCVYLTGGGAASLAPVLTRGWPAHPSGEPWRFARIEEATLRGLAVLGERGGRG
jgi:sugar (pentulose or hexulose) kinase